ncbi:SAUR-like auxin-responsive protein family [Prunus dulcis]|uniref:SAUR-like auxin-responsive protein family n=1 Tax=Prunus dulcis TaxID=3755 RepID=A0A4Y1S198_PRUDU|nr:SAUR-like auxin-responsive protein family [Prunus dulcis]
MSQRAILQSMLGKAKRSGL